MAGDGHTRTRSLPRPIRRHTAHARCARSTDVDALHHQAETPAGHTMSALAPLSALFGACVALRNSLYDHGILRSRRLKWPVISIGNLSVGGAGKTPFTILLGELLQSRQIPFDILSRGYGRTDHR